MASSSGTSSATISLSEEELKVRQEQRKRRRMDSNRESARRSRMRKRKQLEDLTAEAERLKGSCNTAITALAAVNQHLMAVEEENRVLRTQVGELSSRLQALNEIVSCVNGINIYNNSSNAIANAHYGLEPILYDYNALGSGISGFDMNPWSSSSTGTVSLMASGDPYFHCY